MIDAVTLDAYGTLLELDRPRERLRAALRKKGIERGDAEIERALESEFSYYTTHKVSARDAATLARLRTACARVFVEALGADLDFTDDFVAALAFRPLDGVRETLERLRAHGLVLGVVSNWDVSLPEHLAGAGIDVDTVVTAAEVGVEKPDPRPLLVALERLGVTPERALHVGDDPADEQAAAAAGMSFARAPLADAMDVWLR